MEDEGGLGERGGGEGESGGERWGTTDGNIREGSHWEQVPWYSGGEYFKHKLRKILGNAVFRLEVINNKK